MGTAGLTTFPVGVGRIPVTGHETGAALQPFLVPVEGQAYTVSHVALAGGAHGAGHLRGLGQVGPGKGQCGGGQHSGKTGFHR
ncbi:hypothetical protein D3C81_1741850 [compost metagenome]